jgi:CRP/FNR family transcriptional regulator, cyclic AMP receptor protein
MVVQYECETKETQEQSKCHLFQSASFSRYRRGGDQLFHSSEKRLARTLLLLARYGKQEQPDRILPKVSQETLASMVGTTRSRVNFFMNKFRKLGFIEYNGKIKVNKSLLTVVWHE